MRDLTRNVQQTDDRYRMMGRRVGRLTQAFRGVAADGWQPGHRSGIVNPAMLGAIATGTSDRVFKRRGNEGAGNAVDLDLVVDTSVSTDESGCVHSLKAAALCIIDAASRCPHIRIGVAVFNDYFVRFNLPGEPVDRERLSIQGAESCTAQLGAMVCSVEDLSAMRGYQRRVSLQITDEFPDSSTLLAADQMTKATTVETYFLTLTPAKHADPKAVEHHARRGKYGLGTPEDKLYQRKCVFANGPDDAAKAMERLARLIVKAPVRSGHGAAWV